jgi:hypothetical protein
MPIGRRTFVKGLAALTLIGCAKPPTAPEETPTPTPTPAPDGFTIFAVGDIGDCARRGVDTTARIANWLLMNSGYGVIRFHTLGDNAYPDGSESAYKNCFAPAWGQFRDILYPCVGNHDWELANPYYFTYFGPRAIWNGKDGYYSYTEGPWLVLVLNSELIGDRAKREEQMTFVRRELAAHPEKRVVGIWHRPRLAHGRNGDTRGVQEFVDVLSGRVALTLHGHEHYYERFYSLNASAVRDDANGFRQFIVGTGGGELYEFRNVRCAISAFRRAGDYGMLRLRLRTNGTYSWEYFTWPDGRAEPLIVDSDATPASPMCP